MSPPGLQPERTSLAWQRTGLAGATAAMVMLRLAVGEGSPVAAILAGAMLLIALASLVQGSLGHGPRRRGFDAAEPVRGLPAVARATTVGIVLLAGAGLVLVAGW